MVFHIIVWFRWILTAAHCLERYHEIVAYFGIISAKEYSKKAVLPMSNQYMHPLYNATTIVHDIGSSISLIILTDCELLCTVDKGKKIHFSIHFNRFD